MTSRVWGRGSVGSVVPVAVALVLLLAGCSSAGEDTPSPSGGETSATTSPSPSVAVPESTPVVEPADGPVIRTENATIRGLKGYKRVSDFGVVQGYRDDQATLTLAPGYTDKPSLDAFARQQIRVSKVPRAMKRVDDVVVGGKYNAFHLLDSTESDVYEKHVFGVMFLNGSWTINLNFYERDVGNGTPLDADERQEVMDRILASFEVTTG